MTKQEIGAILMNLREKSGKSREEVAELLGKSVKTIGHWETGYAQPDANTLFLLCVIYDADLNTSFGFSSSKSQNQKAPSLSDGARKLAMDYDSLDGHGKRVVRLVTYEEKARCEADQKAKAAALRDSLEKIEASEEIVPDASEMLVYINPAAAGTPLYAESDFERLTFPADKVPRGTDFGIRISGRSMEPTVMDGSIAWVRKRQEIPNETVGIFMLNDSAVCKRYFKGVDGSVRLKSDNPDFPDVPVTEFDNFVLVGEVVGTV